MRISIDEPEIRPVEKTEESEEREAVKKTFKGEKKKLSRMTFSEQIRYIWSYYKAPIIGGLVGILLVGYIISFVSTRKTAMLMGVVINDTGLKVQEFAQELGAYLGLGEKQEVNLLESVFLSSTATGNTLSHNMSGTSQILSLVAARELDFALCDEDGFSYMKTNELCKNVTGYMAEEVKAVFSDRLVIPDGWEYPAAIDLTGTVFASELGLHQEKTYLVLVGLSGHDEQLSAFLQYLAEKK